mmetsp:Transcript_41691/g.99963  ORF Transcript_41691/g.99963 Transcript_41691/m.99963 type:complete len:213 (-) Transcript_41691:683-1321(-)
MRASSPVLRTCFTSCSICDMRSSSTERNSTRRCSRRASSSPHWDCRSCCKADNRSSNLRSSIWLAVKWRNSSSSWATFASSLPLCSDTSRSLATASLACKSKVCEIFANLGSMHSWRRSTISVFLKRFNSSSTADKRPSKRRRLSASLSRRRTSSSTVAMCFTRSSSAANFCSKWRRPSTEWWSRQVSRSWSFVVQFWSMSCILDVTSSRSR